MILVDDRDGSRGLLRYKALHGRAVLGRLEFGDVLLSGHGPGGSSITVGVEVKSVRDLLSSISTGRLGGHQIPGMLKAYDYSWLLVHGQTRPSPENILEYRHEGKPWRKYAIGQRPVPWSYLEGFLLTASMVGGVQVKMVASMEEAAAWLAVFSHWLEKPWDRHRGLSVFDQSRAQAALPESDPVEMQMARTAASIPMLGWDRAWSAARHFSSITEMFDATEKDWTEIRGIGPVIAKSVVETVRRRKR